MRVHRMGNARPVRLRLVHCRGRTNWERPALFDQRSDSPAMAQIFSCALERLGLAVSSPPCFCQVCVMKRWLLVLPDGTLFSQNAGIV